MNLGYNRIKKIIIRILIGWKALRFIKNWHMILIDYCGFFKKPNIIYVFRNGLRFKTRANNKDDRAVIKEVWLYKNYLFTKEDIQNGSIVIDLGAHIGAFSIFAANYAKHVKVFSYEPFSENFNLLLENIVINKLQENIFPFNLAVSDVAKKIKFFIDEKSTVAHSAIIPSPKHIILNAISLVDIFEKNNIRICDLLKIDIEGSEYPVLYNTPIEVLRRIRRMVLEYEDINAFSDYNHYSLKKFLEHSGFNVIHKHPFLYATRRYNL